MNQRETVYPRKLTKATPSPDFVGVTKTHGRPHVSNDNPYSESQFKTLKYSPEFPDRFGALQDARSFLLDFFLWYNTMHHHSGLGWLTPFDVHHGLAEQRIAEREVALRKAFTATPERFVRGVPTPPALPREVWINKPRTQEEAREAFDTKLCPEVSHSC